MMSDSNEQTISLEALYDTMSKEADGLYKQMITICTAFLGGTLVFFEKLFVSKAGWSIYFLFGGWAALTYCRQTKKPLIMQIEKHNMNVYPMFRIILVLDVFEHAYYLDYKNDRAKFIDAFWHIVNWREADKRLTDLLR